MLEGDRCPGEREKGKLNWECSGGSERGSLVTGGVTKVALGQNPEDCLKELKDQATQMGVECEMSRAMIYPSACPQRPANQYMFAESIQLLYLFFIA